MTIRDDLATLVIGDIHHKTSQADAMIEKHRRACVQIVFLGDYFDDFGDNTDRMRLTCHWLADSLKEPNRIHLLGNHDLPYFLPAHSQAKCPGWTPEKQRIFERERTNLPLSSFYLAASLGAWVLSHAGIPAVHAKAHDSVALSKQIDDEFRRAQAGAESWIFDCGRARGGDSNIGSILWLDWPREFRPVAGLNQIVGHTPARGVARGKYLTNTGLHRQFECMEPSPFPRMSKLPQPGTEYCSANWCLDTGLVIAGMISCGELALVV